MSKKLNLTKRDARLEQLLREQCSRFGAKIQFSARTKKIILAGIFVCSGLLLTIYLRGSVHRDFSADFPNVCPLHGTNMKSERVRASPVIVFIDYSQDYVEAFHAAQKELFPYSGHKLWDGRYRGRWVRWIDRKYCPDCVQAQDAWDRNWMDRMQQSNREIHDAEQPSSGQPATRPESKSEGGDKPQPDPEGRFR